MNRPRLTERALRKLEETAEAEEAVGDREVATALQLLLQWYKQDLPE